MRRLFVLILLMGIAVLLQRCDDESTCGTYLLTAQVDLQDKEGGDVIFTYNADGSLQKVSGRDQAEDNLFYDANKQLIRVEQNSEAMPKTVLFFDYDAKGRVISRYQEDNFPGDSMVFEYDDSDRIIKASHYWSRTEIFFYYDIEYPDAGTVKMSVYLRGQYTPELELSFVDTYTMDNHPRPHPREYYLYQFPIEDIFLPHNPLSKHTAGGTVTTHTYTYNGRGYPVSEDYLFKYVYSCD